MKLTRGFELGQDVLVTNIGGTVKWVRGVVVEILGSSDFNIRLGDGRVVHRHVDQMVSYYASLEKSTEPGLCEDSQALVMQEPGLPCVPPEPAVPCRAPVTEGGSIPCVEAVEPVVDSDRF